MVQLRYVNPMKSLTGSNRQNDNAIGVRIFGRVFYFVVIFQTNTPPVCQTLNAG
jgi:hypothetical protein